MTLNPAHIFPLVLMALNLAASVTYAFTGNIRMSVYWFACAVLTFCVTFEW